MKEKISSRERMKLALTGKIPDRIPCAPDISNMIPCRLTGKPFTEIYLRNNPSLWKAYLNAVDYYGIDGWFTYGAIDFEYENNGVYVDRTVRFEGGREIVRNIIHTPAGDLSEETTFYPADSPSPTEKKIKDFKTDFPKLKYLFPKIKGYKLEQYNGQVKALGEKGIMAVSLAAPGFHIFEGYFQGSLEACVYAYYDYPELFEEFTEMYVESMRKQLEIILEVKPDSVLTGGSGSITLQSNELFDLFSLPYLKEITAACKQRGIITGVHSCGKEEYLIKQCALHTDLDYVNPLEIPPMGDCDLKKIKETYGKKLALMGNLHTTNVMLNGSASDVESASLSAILDAGGGGGFVLSTGDQCGRDTPDENIRAMLKITKEYGAYPLDLEKIEDAVAQRQTNAIVT